MTDVYCEESTLPGPCYLIQALVYETYATFEASPRSPSLKECIDIPLKRCLYLCMWGGSDVDELLGTEIVVS